MAGGIRKPNATAASSSPGGGVSADGKAFLRNFIFDQEHPEYVSRNTAVGQARNVMQARASAELAENPEMAAAVAQAIGAGGLQGLPGSKRDFMLHLYQGKNAAAPTLADATKRVNSALPVKEEDLVAAAVNTYGGSPEEAVNRMLQVGVENARISEPSIQDTVNGATRAAAGLGRQLISENPDPRLWAALGVDEQAVRQRYGGAMPAQTPAPAAAAANAAADAAAASMNEPPMASEPQLPSWLPHMQRLTPAQTGMAYGFAAAGAGAAGLALANHLAARGLQQQSPVDYAAAAQAMNAY